MGTLPYGSFLYMQKAIQINEEVKKRKKLQEELKAKWEAKNKT